MELPKLSRWKPTWRNPAAARLEVNVLPAFWQTPSFRAALAGALLAGIIALVYYISTQKLQRQLAGLRQQRKRRILRRHLFVLGNHLQLRKNVLKLDGVKTEVLAT